ncbi:Crp/Fnr family transcriptional regulator [Limibacter armeniacum]|uniref:Crp/Fnr family transcriptional regulator n=1 Tax=Limibacter armeniacum TaxID=466084 RepID=UPI002FE6B9F6
MLRDSERIIEMIRQTYSGVFDESLTQKIGEVGVIKTFEQGEYLMDIGNDITAVPLIINGSLKVVREDEEGREILLYYMERADTCAMSLTCCLRHKRSGVRVVAEEAGTAIMVSVQDTEEWMGTNASWRAYVMESYTFRMEEMLRAIDQLAFQKMDERLLNYLINKSEVKNSRKLSISHAEIAIDLNTSREVVSRLLKKLEKENVIQLGRNQLEIMK